MATRNGRIPQTELAALPTSWSNKGRKEYLTVAAYGSLSRALSRAVAETGVNFQIFDAYRSLSEQEALLEQNYTRTSGTKKLKSSDRIYNGRRWAKKAGHPNTATPGLSNHGLGNAIDIHPGPIQQWMQTKGRDYGWSWAEGKRNGEPWHFTYSAGADKHRDEGVLDHAWVQRVVGAEVDGKIGAGTVAKIKAFQKKHKLEVDGKVGPATKKAMRTAGKGEAAPEPEVTPAPAPDASRPVSGEPEAGVDGYVYTYTRTQWDTEGIGAKVHPFETTVEGVYLHFPGSGNIEMADETPTQIASRLRGYRADHVDRQGWNDIGYNAAVDQLGNSYELRGLGNESGANGGSESNNHGVAILCMVGNEEEPSEALIAAVNGLIAQVKAKRDSLAWIRGHRQSPDASTDCPGEPIMALLEQGDVFVLDGVPGASQGPDIRPPSKKVDEDGRLGTETIAELQRRLGVKDDGRAGEKTWTALQEFLSAPVVDGKISRQSYRADELGNGIVAGPSWEFTGRGSEGSKTVKLMQAYVGANHDGTWYEGTTAKLQSFMNRFPAGFTRADMEIAKQRAKAKGLR